MKRPKPGKPRNYIAKDLRTLKYRIRIKPNKKRERRIKHKKREAFFDITK